MATTLSASSKTPKSSGSKAKKAKSKRTGRKLATRTKVIVRRLPPNVPEEKFLESVKPWANELTTDWYVFYPGRVSKSKNKENIFSRAYFHFKTSENVLEFHRGYDNHLFIDSKGVETRAIVEFATFQKLPKDHKKVDPRQGTIDSDLDYLAFVESLKAEENAQTASKEINAASESGATQLERLETKLAAIAANAAAVAAAVRKPKTTPLLEHIRALKSGTKAKSPTLKSPPMGILVSPVSPKVPNNGSPNPSNKQLLRANKTPELVPRLPLSAPGSPGKPSRKERERKKREKEKERRDKGKEREKDKQKEKGKEEREKEKDKETEGSFKEQDKGNQTHEAKDAGKEKDIGKDREFIREKERERRKQRDRERREAKAQAAVAQSQQSQYPASTTSDTNNTNPDRSSEKSPERRFDRRDAKRKISIQQRQKDQIRQIIQRPSATKEEESEAVQPTELSATATAKPTSQPESINPSSHPPSPLSAPKTPTSPTRPKEHHPRRRDRDRDRDRNKRQSAEMKPIPQIKILTKPPTPKLTDKISESLPSYATSPNASSITSGLTTDITNNGTPTIVASTSSSSPIVEPIATVKTATQQQHNGPHSPYRGRGGRGYFGKRGRW
ncbi:hypothetical protein G9A89_002570 [Geosiphon pyriformis]|nr:hypothetical protein G9A89_002570 [Geosiphon pyriformis]